MLLTSAEVVLRLAMVRIVLLMLLPAAATRVLLKFVLLCVLVSARLLRRLVFDGPVFVICLICTASRWSSSPATLISLLVMLLLLVIVLILVVLPVEILSLALTSAKAGLDIVVVTTHLSRGSLMIISFNLHLRRSIAHIVVGSVVCLNVIPIALPFVLASLAFLSLASTSLAMYSVDCGHLWSSTCGEVVGTIFDFHTGLTVFPLSSMCFLLFGGFV